MSVVNAVSVICFAITRRQSLYLTVQSVARRIIRNMSEEAISQISQESEPEEQQYTRIYPYSTTRPDGQPSKFIPLDPPPSEILNVKYMTAYTIAIYGSRRSGKNTFFQQAMSKDILRVLKNIMAALNFYIVRESGPEIEDEVIKTTHGFIVMFSVADRVTFNRAPDFIQQIRDIKGEEETAILLLGNKIDDERRRVVRTLEAADLAQSLDVSYRECSAKTGEMVEESLKFLGQQVYEIEQKKPKRPFHMPKPRKTCRLL